MHSGLTPLITQPASTDHTCILYMETFPQSVLARTNTHALSVMHSCDTDTYLCVYTLYTSQHLKQRPTYCDHACTCLHLVGLCVTSAVR